MVVPSTITNLLMEDPMSSQEPSLLTRLKNTSPRMSQNSCSTFSTSPKSQPRASMILTKNRETTW